MEGSNWKFSIGMFPLEVLEPNVHYLKDLRSRFLLKRNIDLICLTMRILTFSALYARCATCSERLASTFLPNSLSAMANCGLLDNTRCSVGLDELLMRLEPNSVGAG